MKLNVLLVIAFFTAHQAFSQLVLPGDYPDPSVTKIGNTYWASATTSNWAPAYPLLKSEDLIHWKQEGFVFDQLPTWADFYFWAPEISYDKGKVFIYYSAHKKDGNLCLGIASADKPEGPYKDHGPLMCEPDGSIDGFPMRDENGKLYLIWKEDGNSIQQPTPIWAMEMNEDRTTLIGEKKELFRNDLPWEANLVEGVSMIRQGEYFYAFYAGAGCCGRGCTYATGVARAKSLLGPWEKYEKNPVLSGMEDWKCPGHGTPIEKDGKFYFLYHAYHKEGDVYAGRQGLLTEFKFTPDGWIEFLKDDEKINVAAPPVINDEFDAPQLSDNWQWSVFQKVKVNQVNGTLALHALPGKAGAFVGQKTYTTDYQVNLVLSAEKSNAEAGLALIGDEKNIVSITFAGNKLKVSIIKGDQETQLPEQTIKVKDNLHLEMKVRNGKDITFAYSLNGKKFEVFNKEAIDGFFLPPWDRALRVGMVTKGDENKKAVFESFMIKNQTKK